MFPSELRKKTFQDLLKIHASAQEQAAASKQNQVSALPDETKDPVAHYTGRLEMGLHTQDFPGSSTHHKFSSVKRHADPSQNSELKAKEHKDLLSTIQGTEATSEVEGKEAVWQPIHPHTREDVLSAPIEQRAKMIKREKYGAIQRARPAQAAVPPADILKNTSTLPEAIKDVSFEDFKKAAIYHSTLRTADHSSPEASKELVKKTSQEVLGSSKNPKEMYRLIALTSNIPDFKPFFGNKETSATASEQQRVKRQKEDPLRANNTRILDAFEREHMGHAKNAYWIHAKREGIGKRYKDAADFVSQHERAVPDFMTQHMSALLTDIPELSHEMFKEFPSKLTKSVLSSIPRDKAEIERMFPPEVPPAPTKVKRISAKKAKTSVNENFFDVLVSKINKYLTEASSSQKAIETGAPDYVVRERKQKELLKGIKSRIRRRESNIFDEQPTTSVVGGKEVTHPTAISSAFPNKHPRGVHDIIFSHVGEETIINPTALEDETTGIGQHLLPQIRKGAHDAFARYLRRNNQDLDSKTGDVGNFGQAVDKAKKGVLFSGRKQVASDTEDTNLQVASNTGAATLRQAVRANTALDPAAAAVRKTVADLAFGPNAHPAYAPTQQSWRELGKVISDQHKVVAGTAPVPDKKAEERLKSAHVAHVIKKMADEEEGISTDKKFRATFTKPGKATHEIMLQGPRVIATGVLSHARIQGSHEETLRGIAHLNMEDDFNDQARNIDPNHPDLKGEHRKLKDIVRNHYFEIPEHKRLATTSEAEKTMPVKAGFREEYLPVAKKLIKHQIMDLATKLHEKSVENVYGQYYSGSKAEPKINVLNNYAFEREHPAHKTDSEAAERMLTLRNNYARHVQKEHAAAGINIPKERAVHLQKSLSGIESEIAATKARIEAAPTERERAAHTYHLKSQETKLGLHKEFIDELSSK
jgi:hypothetical protein